MNAPLIPPPQLDPKPAGHPPTRRRRVGVLLLNLGTPDSPDAPAVRRYIKEFLSDRRVVEIPPIIWQPILRALVLTTRPSQSAEHYAKVWDYGPDGGSPLRVITRDQANALEGAFGPDVTVDWALRYGKPSIPDRLAALKAAGCDRILVAPLYPQYSAATTATGNDKAFEVLQGMRWQPALRTLPPYFDDASYIDALAASVEMRLGKLDFAPELLLTSFHGMPRRTLELGDPYHCQCAKTSRLLGERLRMPVRLSFQSRFGRAKWLEPYTDETLEALPGEGLKRIAVIAPGFAADCLETLEEIDLRGRKSFFDAGGQRFAYLPCLNATPLGVAMLRTLIARELAGWVDPA